MNVEQARALRQKIDAASQPADATEAAAVRAALNQLSTDAAAARTQAEAFRNATAQQKNTLVQQSYDNVLDSLADAYDIIAKLIKATVRP